MEIFAKKNTAQVFAKLLLMLSSMCHRWLHRQGAWNVVLPNAKHFIVFRFAAGDHLGGAGDHNGWSEAWSSSSYSALTGCRFGVTLDHFSVPGGWFSFFLGENGCYGSRKAFQGVTRISATLRKHAWCVFQSILSMTSSSTSVDDQV